MSKYRRSRGPSSKAGKFLMQGVPTEQEFLIRAQAKRTSDDMGRASLTGAVEVSDGESQASVTGEVVFKTPDVSEPVAIEVNDDATRLSLFGGVVTVSASPETCRYIHKLATGSDFNGS